MTSASTQILGALVAVALLGALPASAQSITSPDKKVAPAPKPKPAAKPAAKLSDEIGTDYWAINTDLGKYNNRSETPAERTALSRQPLKTGPGTVGFTSESIKAGTFIDGRSAPGLERYNQDPQSYVGMSLSVTSNEKGFPLAVPVLPRNTNW